MNGTTRLIAGGTGEVSLPFDQPFERREITRAVCTGEFTPLQCEPTGGYVLQPTAQEPIVEHEGER